MGRSILWIVHLAPVRLGRYVYANPAERQRLIYSTFPSANYEVGFRICYKYYGNNHRLGLLAKACPNFDAPFSFHPLWNLK